MECPDCGSEGPFVENYSAGEVVCMNCGLVLQDHVLEENTPCVASRPDTSRRALHKGKYAKDRKEVKESQELNAMCDVPGFQSIRIICQEIWKNAKSNPRYKFRKGDNALGYNVAIVFHACKMCNVPRTPRELCEIFGATLSSMRRMVKEVQEAADSIKFVNSYSFASPNVPDIIHRFLQKLELSKQDAILLKKCAEDLWERHNSMLRTYEADSVIAGMIYFMYGANQDFLEKIASACNVCGNTVKGIYTKISTWESESTQNLLEK